MERLDFCSDRSGRADKVLSEQVPGLSRSAAARLLEEGHCLISGSRAGKKHLVREGDPISLTLPDPEPMEALPENIPLDIVYEDGDLLVVNKPKGMVVHPAAGNYTGTLCNALLRHCEGSLSGIGGKLRPGIVHRIDKDTSGLLVVAKNDLAHAALSEQIKEHSVKREYEAVVYGRIKEDEGTVDAPIGRHPTKRKQMTVTEKDARHAVTHYSVICRYEGFTHMRFRLETGRTHQIRVHMAYLGHPIAGDPVYGPKKVIASLEGQCLHARTLGFLHPRSGEYIEFKSPLPDYFTNFLRGLRETD